MTKLTVGISILSFLVSIAFTTNPILQYGSIIAVWVICFTIIGLIRYNDKIALAISKKLATGVAVGSNDLLKCNYSIFESNIVTMIREDEYCSVIFGTIPGRYKDVNLFIIGNSKFFKLKIATQRFLVHQHELILNDPSHYRNEFFIDSTLATMYGQMYVTEAILDLIEQCKINSAEHQFLFLRLKMLQGKLT